MICFVGSFSDLFNSHSKTSHIHPIRPESITTKTHRSTLTLSYSNSNSYHTTLSTIQSTSHSKLLQHQHSTTTHKNALVYFPGLDNQPLPQNQIDHFIVTSSKIKFDLFSITLNNNNNTSEYPTWNEISQQTSELLDSLINTYSQIWICGESFGALIALKVAQSKSNSIHRLIIINSATALNYHQPALSSISSLVSLSAKVNLSERVLYPIAARVVWRILVNPSRLDELHQPRVGTLGSIDTDASPLKPTAHRIELVKSFELENVEELQKIPLLIVASGKDCLLESKKEMDRLKSVFVNAKSIVLEDSAHACLLEKEVKLMNLIEMFENELEEKKNETKSSQRRGDGVRKDFEMNRDLLERARMILSPWKSLTSPMFLGEDQVRRAIEMGRSRPILFVCNHTVHGILDLPLLMDRLLTKHNIELRPFAHASHFEILSKLTQGRWGDIAEAFGAVRATPRNYFRLLSMNQNILLYPGGAREVCRRRGDEYYAVKWKDEVDFVRPAVKFNALIVPVSAIGADDSVELILDTEEQLEFPILGGLIKNIVSQNGGDLEHLHPITTFPKPERMYFQFHSVIDCSQYSMDQSSEIYDRVRSNVENGIQDLIQYRNRDPQRSLVKRSVGSVLNAFWEM
mmetsp:Transcript_8266/g.14960  ORF Transcript_8266/g.14960 Transcript_8266/m.14960 type:complete len:631 (-) Transcript_8266:1047-2939(-)